MAAQERPDPTAVGNGARALGMSNAVTAIVNDLSAIGWNPAGLSYIDRTEISAVARVMVLSTGAEASTNVVTATGFPSFSGDGEYAGALDPLEIGGIAIPFRIAQRRVTFGLAYRRFEASLRPGSFKVNRLESNGRYFSTTKYFNEGAVRSIAPAVGIQLNDRLRVGATVNILSGEQSYAVKGPLTFKSYVAQEDYSGIAPEVGLMYRWNETLQLGAQVTLPHDRKFTIDNDTTAVAATLSAPIQVAVGLAKQLNAKATLTVDARYAPWSSASYTADASGNDLPTNVGTQDALGLAVGYERDVTNEDRRSSIRTGVFFRSTTFEDLNAKQVSAFGLSVGQSWYYEQYTVDLGAMLARSTKWTRSSTTQTTVSLSNQDVIVSLGLRRHFGTLRRGN